MARSVKLLFSLLLLLACTAWAHTVVDAEESAFELESDEGNLAGAHASLFSFPVEEAAPAPAADIAAGPADAQPAGPTDAQPAPIDPAAPAGPSDPAAAPVDPAAGPADQAGPAGAGPAGPGPAGPTDPHAPVENDPCALAYVATPSNAPMFTNGNIGDGANPELQQRQQDVQQALTNLRQQAIDACHAWKQRQEDAATAVASAAGATHETLERQLQDNEAAEQRSIDDLHVVQDEVAAQEAKLAAATKHLEDVKMKYAAAKAIREASDQGTVRQYGMFDAYSGHYKSVHGGFNTVERTQLRHRL